MDGTSGFKLAAVQMKVELNNKRPKFQEHSLRLKPFKFRLDYTRHCREGLLISAKTGSQHQKFTKGYGLPEGRVDSFDEKKRKARIFAPKAVAGAGQLLASLL